MSPAGLKYKCRYRGVKTWVLHHRSGMYNTPDLQLPPVLSDVTTRVYQLQSAKNHRLGALSLFVRDFAQPEQQLRTIGRCGSGADTSTMAQQASRCM